MKWQTYILLSFLLLVSYPEAGLSLDSFKVTQLLDNNLYRVNDTTLVKPIGIESPSWMTIGGPGEPYSRETNEFLRKRLLNKKVYLDFTPAGKYSKEGYLQGYILLPGTVDLGALLLEKGMAKAAKRPYNHPRYNVYHQLEERAKKEQVGRWKPKKYVTYDKVRKPVTHKRKEPRFHGYSSRVAFDSLRTFYLLPYVDMNYLFYPDQKSFDGDSLIILLEKYLSDEGIDYTCHYKRTQLPHMNVNIKIADSRLFREVDDLALLDGYIHLEITAPARLDLNKMYTVATLYYDDRSVYNQTRDQLDQWLKDTLWDVVHEFYEMGLNPPMYE